MVTHSGVHEKGKFSIIDAINDMKSKSDFRKAGAITIFIGVVRGETLKGEKVQKLTLEAYEEKANEVLTKICDDLTRKKGIVDVQIHHFLGEFDVGEDLVYVLVAGEHRKNIFPVLEEAVKRYKREAPIFKKEEIITHKGEKKAYWATEKQGI